MNMKTDFFKILALVFLFSSSTFAHSRIEETTPAKESTVKDFPKQVKIKFSEALETAMSKIEVKNLTTGEVISERSVSPDNDKSILETSLKPQKAEKAKFEVSWKAVSKDSHTMKGTYDFTVDPSVK
jgi:methionine-rich copper-binding protein CopC